MAKMLFLQNMDYEFVGPMYISAMVKSHGHECDLAIGHKIEDFEKIMEKYQPDIVGFSVMSGSHNWGKRIAIQLKEKYGVLTLFGGAHPTFFQDFIREEVGLPFICLVRADLVAADREYAFNLAKGGCQSVFFGVESGNEDLRNQVLKKQLNDKQIIEAAELLHEAGITFRTYNILGLPDETLEDAFSTVELNIKIKADYPWCSIFSPFPGTELSDYALSKGYLSPTFSVEELDKSFFLSSQLDLPHKRELQNLQKFFQTAVLWPWTFPLIKKLIKLPPNFLFRAWFGFIYFRVYIRSEKRNFWETFKFAIKNYKHVLVKE